MTTLTNIISGGVEIANNDRVVALNRFSKLLPRRRHALAMTAPGRVHLDEDISVRVHHNFIEVLTNDLHIGTLE